MDEHPRGEGGPANTPPFPRLVDDQQSDSPASPPRPGEDETARQASARDPEVEDTGRDRHAVHPGTSGANAEAGDFAPPRPDDSEDAEPPVAGGPRQRLRARTESGLQRGFDRVADRLEETAERLARLADDRLQGHGARARAGDAAQGAAAWIDDVADYLRSSDTDRLRADLERQVRDKPVQSLLIAAATGWIVGKIMR